MGLINHNAGLSYARSLRLCCKRAMSENIAHKENISRVVHVAIIGAPNSGKSTLINRIVGRKVCAASNKVHTTTTLARAMCFQNDTQIIFLDTPGVVTDKEQKKYDLPASMVKSYHKSLHIADVVAVVHDVSNSVTKDSLHTHVVSILNQVERIPSFLILNKIDILESKKRLLDLIRNLTNGYIAGQPIPLYTKSKKEKSTDIPNKSNSRGYSRFSDVFMVSALKGDGVSEIKDYLIKNAKPGHSPYDEEKWTDQTPERLIEEAVRAKFLDFLAQEIPYSLKVKLEYFDEEEDRIISSVVVECPSERLVRLIAGSGGGRLQQIKSHTAADLRSMFKKQVALEIRLFTKPKENT